jgi:uncharacterized protein (DUF1015 family)
VPTLRPFRALRYAAALGPDLSTVVCPPYDIIPPALGVALRERDLHNAVRVELPDPEPGGEPASRYRAAARTLAEWRTGGVLVKERRPAVYVHEMTWDGSRGRTRGRARGVFARLRLEQFGPEGGVRAHERTMTGPKEDRYRLLKATGVNLSPVILLRDAAPGAVTTSLDRLSAGEPDVVATTDDGVSHRLWTCPASATDDGTATADVAALLEVLGGGPLTIADGHHRYETTLRYQEERGRNRACESDPAWDYVMALLYDVSEAPSVLPTHRVLVSGPAGSELVEALAGLVDVEPVADADTVLATMSRRAPLPDVDATGTGRIGLVSGDVAAILRVRPGAFDPLQDPSSSEASRGLDVNRLALMFERLGVDAEALVAGGRVVYLKDATEAVAQTTRGEGVATFLLDGPPVTAVTRVAAATEVMPQKSTFFDPKAPTGLVFGPLEW